MQFSLTPGKIGLAFFTGAVFYVISAPLLGKVADKVIPVINFVRTTACMHDHSVPTSIIIFME